MNFLAHIYLSGKNENLILGNFIADMVKGRQIEKYGSGVVMGIKLHRQIDQFTDQHHVVKRSKSRLKSRYRHYSGVLVDMYYDHFLALNWDDYSEIPIDKFINNAYNVLFKNYLLLPYRARRILPFMVTANWLVNYADLKKLKKSFEGMAKRTSFESGMEYAVEDLKANYDEFFEDFKEFFPEIIDFVSKLKKSEIS